MNKKVKQEITLSEIGYIGLGKMGFAQVEKLLEKSYRVVAWNRSEGPRAKAKKAGAKVSDTIEGVCAKLKTPRLIWLMVPHAAVDGVLQELVPHLSKGDTIIDGGNSFYRDSMRHAEDLAKKGINFLDCGTSGGPSGARNGACLMVGGEIRVFQRHEKLFQDLSHSYADVLENNSIAKGSYAYVGKAGAGHFVKMVHNGIEYGMMQAIGEGFNVLRTAELRGIDPGSRAELATGRGADGRRKKKFGLNLKQIAELYNNGSVIESRLIGWLAKAFEQSGERLKGISGEVAHSGEGLWTVETARELGVPVKVIKDSLDFRIKSKGNPKFTGQVVSALRNQFGGHDVKK